MKYSDNREINDRVKELIRAGWTVLTGGNHFKLEHPDGHFRLPFPKSKGDHRTSKNFFAQLERAERAGFKGGTKGPGMPVEG